MSIEAQLEKLNSNLEKIVGLLNFHTPSSFFTNSTDPNALLRVPPCDLGVGAPAEEVKSTPASAAKTKAKPKVEEPVATPVEPPAEKVTPPEDGAKVMLDDLAAKVKTLASLGGRDGIMSVFSAPAFNISRLSELPKDKYVVMDLALTKAITKAKGE